MMTTAETPERGYPRKKITNFFKGSRKKSGHSGKKLDRVKKITIFFKSGETKTGCSGDKLGRVNFFSDFFKNGGTKPVQPGEKLGRDKNFRISSKMVRVNGTHRERNLIGTQWR